MYQIIPYIQIDGIPTLRDSEILSLYDKMVEQDLDQIVFMSEPVMSRDKFLAIVKSSGTLFYAVEDSDGSIAAITWLNRFEGKIARMHFCVYKEWWGRGAGIMMEVARHIKSLQDEEGIPIFIRLVGYIPSNNKFALRCALKDGGSICGTIPDYFWDYKNKHFLFRFFS